MFVSILVLVGRLLTGCEPIVWSSVIGYTFSILCGHALIAKVIDQMWQAMGETQPGQLHERSRIWTTRILGMMERGLYTASLQSGYAPFVGIWISLKVASNWGRWSTDKGRKIYNVFMIGNGLSIAFAFVGYLGIGWLENGMWAETILIYSLPVITSIVFWVYAWRHRNDWTCPHRYHGDPGRHSLDSNG